MLPLEVNRTLTGQRLLQLQQLGLPLGFRSRAEWWQNYLISNFNQSYAKKKHPRGPNRYESRNFRFLLRQEIKV